MGEMGKRPRKGRFPHGEVAHDDSHGFDDGAVVRAVSAAGAGVGYSARGGTASGGTHTGFPRRMGVGSSRGGVRRASAHGKLVAQRYGVLGGGAGLGAIPAFHGGVAAACRPGIGTGGRPAAPFNPGWALRALVSYDKWLWDRLHGADACQRMAFTLSAYNGGIGWVGRDRKEAERQGRDPARWFGQVEKVNAGRSASSLRENRRYVRLILLERQYWYRKAGWGPGVGCGGGHD